MRHLFTLAILLLLFSGCASLPELIPATEPTALSTLTATPTITPTSHVPSQASTNALQILRIWVPPQFDPNSENSQNVLFQERLDEFIANHQGLEIEVRVKNEIMGQSLTTTQDAAPSIMPDLVALSRNDIEAIAAEGLLQPLDGLSTLIDNPDWYPYALQLAHVQNTTFGLPFAGDALCLIGYTKSLPDTWNELPEETIFIFPAADSQALFSWSLYLSVGEILLDDQGEPSIDETILADVFSLYQISPETEYISSSSVEYENNDLSWNALLEQRGNLTVNWVSNYLQYPALELNLAPLPGLDGNQFTLATGWSWALTSGNSDNQLLAIELAEFLSDSQFLGEWNKATGYLPTRPTALSIWKDERFISSFASTAESANLVPNQEFLDRVGTIMAEATLSVMNGEQLPEEAAQFVIEQIK